MDRLPSAPDSQPFPLSDPAVLSQESSSLSQSSAELSPKTAASSLESVSSDLESAVSASDSAFLCPQELSLLPRQTASDSVEEELLDFHDDISCGRLDSFLPIEPSRSSNDDHLPRLQVLQGQFSEDISSLHGALKECSDVPSLDQQEEEEEEQQQQRSLSRASSLNAKTPEFIPKNVFAPTISSFAPPATPPSSTHVQVPPPLMMPLGSSPGGLQMTPPSPPIARASAAPLGVLPPPTVGSPSPIPGCMMGSMPILGPPPPGLLDMQLHGPPPTSAVLPPAVMTPSLASSVAGQPQPSHISDTFVTQTVGVNVESVQAPDQPPDLDSAATAAAVSKPVLTDKLKTKIIKQVEYYFSNTNLSADSHLMKYVKKDPEGYVPIPVVASFRKIKNLVKSHVLVATALRSSKQLVVSDNGKKVRRLHQLPDVDLEEVQSRTVVAENLPDDHSIPSMEKLFGKVGNVKMVRVCEPEAANGANQTFTKFIKTDMVVSIKLHALIEYESVEQAERAVSELTDQRTWRGGLHVRPLLRRTFQNKHNHHLAAGSKGRKVSDGGNASAGEEDAVSSLVDDTISEKIREESLDSAERFEGPMGNDTAHNDKDGGSKRERVRGRGRGRGRGQPHQSGGRSHPIGTPPHANSFSNIETKPPPGPRMPDGTRGFTVGRGKLMNSST